MSKVPCLVTLHQNMVQIFDFKTIDSTTQIICHMSANLFCTDKQFVLQDEPKEMTNSLGTKPLPS